MINKNKETIVKLQQGCGKEFEYTNDYSPHYINCGNKFANTDKILGPTCQAKLQATIQTSIEWCEDEINILSKIQNITNNYHSQIPLIEIGRENVLNDLDNEVGIDNYLKRLTTHLNWLKALNLKTGVEE